MLSTRVRVGLDILVLAFSRGVGSAMVQSVGFCLNASKVESCLDGADFHLEAQNNLGYFKKLFPIQLGFFDISKQCGSTTKEFLVW